MTGSSSFASPYAARITGMGSYFPKRVMTNDDLARDLAKRNLETSDEWIRERTGIASRRVSEPGNPAEHNSTLGKFAALNALEMAGKKVEDIDQIIYATCTPDTIIPSTACWVQHKLGAKRAFAYDVNAACSGFVYGLTLADQAIRAGNAKTVLVIGGEVLTSFLNWDDRTSCVLFGDGAGAAVVERVEASSPNRILSTHLGSDGSLWELFYVISGGSNQEVTPAEIEKRSNKMFMKGKEIFKVATKTLADYAVTALEAQGMTTSDLTWLVPHQANLRIIEAVAKRLDFPMSKVLVNIDRYGNTSAATVPTAMDEAIRTGKIKRGDTVLMDVFGAGLTYGSLLMRW
ncbi:MAG: beta-ketoacyl-ACP synthase III [Bacteriovoracia bacterium]